VIALIRPDPAASGGTAIVALLFDPVTLFTLGILVGAVGWKRSRRFAGWIWIASCCALVVLSTPYVAGHLLYSLQTDPPIFAGEPLSEGPQAIVILGAGMHPGAPEYGGATVGRLTLARLRYGAALHRKTGLPVLVSGGHILGNGEALSSAMARALANDLGVTVRWTESQSLNTYENAEESASVLGADGINWVYLVTHASHMLRAAEAFRKAGLQVTRAGTEFTLIPEELEFVDFLPNVGALTASRYAIHELVGRVWYHVAYY